MKKSLKMAIAVICVINLFITNGKICYAEDTVGQVIEIIPNVNAEDSPNNSQGVAGEKRTINIRAGADVSIDDDLGEDYSDTTGEVVDEVSEDSLSGEINFDLPKNDYIDPTLTMNKGIYADDIELSGLTYKEAKDRVNSYIEELKNKQISLKSINDRVKTVSAGQLGLSWDNEDFLEEAITLGKSGNIVARYKENKDLEVEHKVYNVDVDFEKSMIKAVVQEESDDCGSDAKDATLSLENGVFHISEGQAGYGVDVTASSKKVFSDLSDWNKQETSVELVGGLIDPKGKASDLEKVQDLLGSFTTSFSSSGSERSGNVRNGTKLINGTVLFPGDQLSVYETVSPFSEENGYFLAGSYSNGLVVESLGGGICQVSSTLYNAVLRAELQVDERSNHSMIVNYVDMSADAAISGTYKDFKFTNSSDAPIYIEGYTTADKQVVFNVYGHETRPSNRSVSFESVEISKTEPEGEKIVADSSLPVGEISVQSAHTGYVGELWKIVKVDGVETERERVNKSTYQAVPKTASVGTAADNPAFTQMINAAIASGSIATCKETINQLRALAQSAPVVPVPQSVEPVQGEPDLESTYSE